MLKTHVYSPSWAWQTWRYTQAMEFPDPRQGMMFDFVRILSSVAMSTSYDQLGTNSFYCCSPLHCITYCCYAFAYMVADVKWDYAKPW